MNHPDVDSLVRTWFHYLDIHQPLADVRQFLDHDRIRMVFPEATLESIEDFDAWYTGVIGIFFDEEHTLRRLECLDGADLYAVDVEWRASTWTPPEPRSKQVHMLARQTWIIAPDDNGVLKIRDYVVDALEPLADHEA